MQLARSTPVRVAPARRVAALPSLARRGIVVRRAADPAKEAADAAAAALDKATSVAKDAADKATAAAKDAASKAKDVASAKVAQVRDAIATLDVDIGKLLQYNFIAQLALTAVSWAVVFLTSHASLAGGGGVNPIVAILLVGLALSGYSTYLSYGYLTTSKSGGQLEGWTWLGKFYEHIAFNFAGAAAALFALFAQIGTLLAKSAVGKGGSFSTEVLAQAAGNVLLAHLVSLAILLILTKKITQAYQAVAEWSSKLDDLRASIPRVK